MATIDVGNNMSFFPTSYSTDGQSTTASSYSNPYPASSNYMNSGPSSFQTGFEDELPLLEGIFYIFFI